VDIVSVASCGVSVGDAVDADVSEDVDARFGNSVGGG